MALADDANSPNVVEDWTDYLQGSDELTSNPPEDFSRLTELATRLLNVPVAHLSLLARDTVVVFSSRADSVIEYERNGSLCASVASRPGEVTLVTDVDTNSEWTQNDLSLDDEEFASYAGTPITLDGKTVGSFGVRDKRTRDFTDDDVETLRLFAGQATDLLEKFRIRAELENNRERTDGSNSSADEYRRTEQEFKDIEQAPIAFLRSNEEFEFIQVNKQACEQLGYEREELLELTIMDVNPTLDSKEDVTEIIGGLEPGEVDHLESTHQRKDGSTFPISAWIRKTRPGAKGRLVSWVSDISESKKRERKLRTARNRFQKIIDLAPVAITGLELTGEVVIWNPAAEELFGWSRDEVIGRKLSELEHYFPESKQREHEGLRERIIQGQGINNFETKRQTKDGEVIDVLISTASVHDETGEPEIALGIIQDITQLKETQEELQRALDEKANLLREVHHRVKNNLQMIKSMINLHERSVEQYSGELMNEVRQRIQTMAMIHDMLYQSEDLARLPFHRYVEELVETILSLHNYTGSETDVSLDLESSVGLDLTQAFPCGLIVHELVSNVCKHAFDDAGENRMKISMKTTQGDELVLRVKDNGPGFPEDLDLKEVDSIGFDILKSLIDYELDGSIDVTSEEMTTVEVRFELTEREPRRS